MKTKTRAYKKVAYSFPVPISSKLILYLKWFDKNRDYVRKDDSLYQAVKEHFRGYVDAVTAKESSWTSRVFRCFRASEFVFRWKEWEVIKGSRMNTAEDVKPENPMQHTTIATTLKNYANAASVTHLKAEARVLNNGYKVSHDPTGLMSIVD